jgi:hypothetical protein
MPPPRPVAGAAADASPSLKFPDKPRHGAPTPEAGLGPGCCRRPARSASSSLCQLIHCRHTSTHVSRVLAVPRQARVSTGDPCCAHARQRTPRRTYFSSQIFKSLVSTLPRLRETAHTGGAVLLAMHGAPAAPACCIPSPALRRSPAPAMLPRRRCLTQRRALL